MAFPHRLPCLERLRILLLSRGGVFVVSGQSRVVPISRCDRPSLASVGPFLRYRIIESRVRHTTSSIKPFQSHITFYSHFSVLFLFIASFVIYFADPSRLDDWVGCLCYLCQFFYLLFPMNLDERQSIRDPSDDHQPRREDSPTNPFCTERAMSTPGRIDDARVTRFSLQVLPSSVVPFNIVLIWLPFGPIIIMSLLSYLNSNRGVLCCMTSATGAQLRLFRLAVSFGVEGHIVTWWSAHPQMREGVHRLWAGFVVCDMYSSRTFPSSISWNL